jgi:hypothetical protein
MATTARLLTTAFLVLAFVAPVSGQWQEYRALQQWMPEAAAVQVVGIEVGEAAAPRSALAIGAGGIAGGLVGALPGILVIHHAAGWEGLGYGVLAAYAGYSLAMPLGAHLSNRRGGKLWANVLTSVGVAAVGLGVLEAAGEDGLYIAIPIAQLAAVVAMERALTR